MNVRLTPEADADINEAAEWYDQQADMGDELLAEVADALNVIERHPRQHGPPPYLPGRESREIRRVLLKRFRYSVIYLIKNEEAFVVAVTHPKRRPNHWLKRIKGL